MSLRIEPVLTQACYIIGCSEKLKNVSETRWIWNVPLFINTFFFFFCICTCSHSQIFCHRNLLKKVWKGTKIFACFSGRCPCRHGTQGARRNGCGSLLRNFSRPVWACLRNSWTWGGGEWGGLWGGLVMNMATGDHGLSEFKALEAHLLQTQLLFPCFWSFQWQALMSFW